MRKPNDAGVFVRLRGDHPRDNREAETRGPLRSARYTAHYGDSGALTAAAKPGALACFYPPALSARAASTPVHDLEAEVLRLPPEERARLPERLIAIFEPRSPAQRAWLDLAQRRRDDIAAGTVAMLPGDEALARVRARIA